MSKFLLNLLLQISKALVNSKIQILIQKFFFLDFGPADLTAHSASGPASPLAVPLPQAETIPAGPSSTRVGHVFVGNTCSLLVHAFRADRLSHVSLSTGPQLSVPSPTSSHPSSPTPPPLPGHRAPPSSTPRVPPDCYHLAFISPPINPLLNHPHL
jgi:hypothetical protein